MFLITLFLIVGYFQAKIWSKIAEKKFDKHIIPKISLLVFVWNLIWVLLFLIIVFGLRFKIDIIKIIAIVETFLFIYLSLILMPIFFRSEKIFKSIKETLFIGTTKFYKIVPSIFVMWLILSITFILFINLSIYSRIILSLIFVVFILCYIIWIKFYINAVISKIYNTKKSEI